MFARILIITLIVLILVSLFSALTFIYRDKGGNTRVVRALTVRISLSIVLFLLLLAGFYFGLIPQQGL